jgi:hypothetical protein
MYYWNTRGCRGRDHICKSHHHMITTTTAPCISVIHDICSCKSHHHCRGREHMVVWFTTIYVMYYWNTKGRRDRDYMVLWFTHMITTTTASCISVIYDICSCKSHHHMITTTTASCISVIRCGRDHMVVWFTTTYVMYYWNIRGRRGRDHMVMWFTTTYVMYSSCISVIYDICSCKSHHHMITNTTLLVFQ